MKKELPKIVLCILLLLNFIILTLNYQNLRLINKNMEIKTELYKARNNQINNLINETNNKYGRELENNN